MSNNEIMLKHVDQVKDALFTYLKQTHSLEIPSTTFFVPTGVLLEDPKLVPITGAIEQAVGNKEISNNELVAGSMLDAALVLAVTQADYYVICRNILVHKEGGGKKDAVMIQTIIRGATPETDSALCVIEIDEKDGPVINIEPSIASAFPAGEPSEAVKRPMELFDAADKIPSILSEEKWKETFAQIKKAVQITAVGSEPVMH